jgi:hypothetical protein
MEDAVETAEANTNTVRAVKRPWQLGYVCAFVHAFSDLFRHLTVDPVVS